MKPLKYLIFGIYVFITLATLPLVLIYYSDEVISLFIYAFIYFGLFRIITNYEKQEETKRVFHYVDKTIKAKRIPNRVHLKHLYKAGHPWNKYYNIFIKRMNLNIENVESTELIC